MLTILQFLLLANSAISFLLYPESTVYQITSSLSVPVVDLPSDRKVSFDWGFQMNYNMPANVSAFYNVPIWPGLYEKNLKNKRNAKIAEGKKQDDPSPLPLREVKHIGDYSAGDLYKSLEGVLSNHGFHASCLLRSICDLANQPFHRISTNVITDALEFLLSPSLHRGFSSGEEHLRVVYEKAEDWGAQGYDCSRLFGKCSQNFLNMITKVVHD